MKFYMYRNRYMEEWTNIEGSEYPLTNWNGEHWTSWDDNGKKIVIRPVYRFDVENIDLCQSEEEYGENSDEMERALEIVDLKIETY